MTEVAVSPASDALTATMEVRVLGELSRIRPSTTVVALPAPGQTGRLTLTGLDADGFGIPLETVTFTADGGRVDVAVIVGYRRRG